GGYPVAGPGSGAAPGVGTGSFVGSTVGGGESFGDSGELGVGKRIGRYEVVGELGRGGMGVVYKARVADGSVPGFVAIKVLLAGEFASERLKERFKVEAEICKRLDHPNIVKVHDVGEVDGLLYYSMDYVQGQELQELIRAKSLPIRRGVEILVEVARAAHNAHENGVIHRDLKPSNVLVGQDGKAYIMDFGLAKNLEADQGLTKSGVAIGTPYYMPPEQARGQHREMGPRSDVYALGAILYEIVTRRVPFTAKTQNALLRKIIEEEPQPPRQVRAGVPSELEIIALKALSKEQDGRFQSANDMADDMQRFLDGQPILARAPAFWKPIVRRLKRNKSQAMIVAAAVVAVVLALVIVVKLRSDYKAQQDIQVKKAEAEAKKAKDIADALAKKEAEAEAKRKARTALTAKRTKALERARDAWNEGQREEYSGSARNSFAASAAAYSEALGYESQLDGKQPATLYGRAKARRGQASWQEAREDFLAAAKASPPTHRARGNLGAALIELKIFGNRQRAQNLLTQVKAAAEIKEGKGAASERHSANLAVAFLAYLGEGYEQAYKRFLSLRANTKDVPREIEAEINGGAAWLERVEGKPLEQDKHSNRGLIPSARCVELDRHRYEFLVDRAMILVRAEGKKLLEEAKTAQRNAQAIDIDGEWAYVANAEICAINNEVAKLKDLQRNALNKAASRSEAVRAKVGAHLRAIDLAARKLGKRKTVLYKKSFTIRPAFRGQGDRGLASLFVCAIEVPAGVEAVAIQVMSQNPRMNVDLFVSDGTRFPQRNDDVEKALSAARLKSTLAFGPDLVVMRRDTRDSSEILRPGRYSILLYKRKTAQPVDGVVSLVCKYLKRGEKIPFTWKSMPTFRFPDQAGLREFEQSQQLTMLGDREGSLEILGRLERRYPGMFVLSLRRAATFMLATPLSKEDAQAALAITRKLIQKHPSEPNVLCMASKAECLGGNKTEGLRLARRAVKIHPRLPDAHEALAEAYIANKKFADATAVLKAASAMRPKATLFLLQAVVLNAQGKRPQALALMNKALSNPIVAGKQTLLFATFRRLEAHEEALSLLAAIERAAGGKGSLDVDLKRCLIYEAWGKLEEARDGYRGIIKKLPPTKAAAFIKIFKGMVAKLEKRIASGEGGKKKKSR
ncbi:MAG: protein kinase, partial [Planctomycetes bacterium]|nr:protein kinase [Planctomycetota bacterium]